MSQARKRRIFGAYSRALQLEIDENSRMVLFSDLHRGRGSGNDEFAKNQKLYDIALRHYFQEGYTYLELGDGDELWQERCMEAIKAEYGNLFGRLADFYREGRLHMLYGNHDNVKADPAWVKAHLQTYKRSHEREKRPLFPGIKVEESIVLNHRSTGQKLLLLHGHQADFFNDRLWRTGRFLVRHIWRPLELVGFRVPFDTSPNPKRQTKAERALIAWAQKQNIPIIAGHTHRPYFPKQASERYYNTGSAIHTRYITAIEIKAEQIALVKWEVDAKEDGALFIGRDILCGPRPMQEIAQGVQMT